ncbi:purine and uridine phosphorylase [Xylariaceae sp. AK1471]|nr:purine and uridine phosphorylase [Xylariaceae sp. AK1471]
MAPEKVLGSRNMYTVGWITALPIELAAAIAVLEEQHKKPLDFVKPTTDENVYIWGRIAEHNIVLASLPAGVYGVTSAAVTATSMLSSFPQIRFGLMVGIGAGIPRLDRDIDIRLGDIVVSQPSGTSGGVIQYDNKAAQAGGQIKRRGFLRPPPQILLSALGQLQAQHEFGSEIPKILEDMFKSHPNLKKATHKRPSYAYQGHEHDKLFKATSTHTPGRDCNNCDPEQQVKRDQRELLDPEIHYGLIVSGNTLVKDAAHRESLLKELDDNCICFEMEAAGLMNNFPCLVIRGICDYADAHKNNRWQRYAAATAAAYAKELLGVVPGEDLERVQTAKDMMELSDNIKEIESITRHTKDNVDNLAVQQRQQKINAWLSPSDPSTNYYNARKQRHARSGQWFLQSEEYITWKSKQNSFLWLNGISGCGKTILSSTIINDLRNTYPDTDNVFYFYFDINDTQKQCYKDAIHSLICQLYNRNRILQHYLDSLYSSCNFGHKPSIETLFTAFQDMVEEAGEVWIVLDALDECQTSTEHPRQRLLEWIRDLIMSKINIHLLATSRPEEDIKTTIES